MRTNDDASHYTTLAGNCFERHYDLFIFHLLAVSFTIITSVSCTQNVKKKYQT